MNSYDPKPIFIYDLSKEPRYLNLDEPCEGCRQARTTTWIGEPPKCPRHTKWEPPKYYWA